MNKRRLTFGARKALAVIGSLEAKLFRSSQESKLTPKALRKQDRLILEAVDGKRSAREAILASGLDYEIGLHSIAWLVQTGFLYSSETLKRYLEHQADRLALFVDLFSDVEHDADFWENEIDSILKETGELNDALPGLSWEGITPHISEPFPAPEAIREYFLQLFISLYDKAEEIFGSEAVLAKRILLDVRPQP
ncbi:MAG: hypothetical protein E3J71_05140 [Candidatus Stahlbacteria bacterium]|nr:MAG: hypothetical protein E3J71_05140 [Candidatus Stahlbacteria bacterium]